MIRIFVRSSSVQQGTAPNIDGPQHRTQVVLQTCHFATLDPDVRDPAVQVSGPLRRSASRTWRQAPARWHADTRAS